MLDVSMVRGDTKPLKITVREITGQVTDIIFDDIFFTVKKSFTDLTPKFQKRLSDGTITKDEHGYYHVKIMPEDTNSLSYGDYVFDIELLKGTAETPDIKYTKTGIFHIRSEATFARNEG